MGTAVVPWKPSVSLRAPPRCCCSGLHHYLEGGAIRGAQRRAEVLITQPDVPNLPHRPFRRDCHLSQFLHLASSRLSLCFFASDRGAARQSP